MYASARPNRNKPRPVKYAPCHAERCQLALCLPALANAHRLALVGKLCDEEASVTELVEWMGLSQPTVSHHLGVLRRAGLVKVRQVGQQRFYRADLQWISHCCHHLFRQLHVQPYQGQGMPAKQSPTWLSRSGQSNRQ